MNHIDWLHWLRVAAATLFIGGAYLGLVLWIARALGEASDRQQEESLHAEREQWLRDQETRRLKRLLEIADEVESAPLAERQRLYREADALGFIDQADEPPRAA